MPPTYIRYPIPVFFHLDFCDIVIMSLSKGLLWAIFSLRRWGSKGAGVVIVVAPFLLGVKRNLGRYVSFSIYSYPSRWGAAAPKEMTLSGEKILSAPTPTR